MFTTRIRMPQLAPSWLWRMLLSGALLTAVMLSGPLVARADAWAGVRTCLSNETCVVKSLATGTVEHYRCNTNGSNCVLRAWWANGSSSTWRTSVHGSGAQMASIYTTGSLTSQSATCVCTAPPCAV